MASRIVGQQRAIMIYPETHTPLFLQLTTLSGGARSVTVQVKDLVIAGWTGRDSEQTEAHIRELEALGIGRPKRTPQFYRIAASLLTTGSVIEVVGRDSTGEVEFVLFQYENSLWVGLGSDHTDRKAEILGVTLAKQLCPKPVAEVAWQLEEAEPHWDELVLRSYAVVENDRLLYQEGSVSALRHPRSLLECYAQENLQEWSPGTCMFCGTLAAANKILWADSYYLELEDPVLKRRIQHEYCLKSLPIQD
jgi:hypothetical protein